MQDDADSLEHIPRDHDGCMMCLADGCYQYGEGAQHKQPICESSPRRFSLSIQNWTIVFKTKFHFKPNFKNIPVKNHLDCVRCPHTYIHIYI